MMLAAMNEDIASEVEIVFEMVLSMKKYQNLFRFRPWRFLATIRMPQFIDQQIRRHMYEMLLTWLDCNRPGNMFR
jgi:hypothetical protein